MDRRAFIVGSVVAVASPLDARAQPTGRVYRIGYLTQGTVMDGSATDRRIMGAFVNGLRELGYVEGQNLSVEWREARGDNSRLPVRLKPELIITISSPPTQAVKQATISIPVVGIAMGDPIGNRFAETLARPGGNITGLAGMTPELTVKWLEVLKDAVPTLSRVIVLAYPDNPVHVRVGQEAAGVARRLGLSLEVAPPGTAVSTGSCRRAKGAARRSSCCPRAASPHIGLGLASWSGSTACRPSPCSGSSPSPGS
jgi:putative ABC transport system substrate-binding protein